MSSDGGLAAESASVLGVLGDFHLLHLLSQGGTVTKWHIRVSFVRPCRYDLSRVGFRLRSKSFPRGYSIFCSKATLAPMDLSPRAAAAELKYCCPWRLVACGGSFGLILCILVRIVGGNFFAWKLTGHHIYR